MKLAKREKYLVITAGCAIAIFIILQFIIFPFFENKKKLANGIEIKEAGLKEIALLSAEYRELKKGSLGIQRALLRRKRGFTLFSFLEQAAGQAGVKENIKYMKPSVVQGTGSFQEDMVEMKLEKVTLKQLTSYLYQIESPENVIRIKRISIKQEKSQDGYLDSVIQVLTFK